MRISDDAEEEENLEQEELAPRAAQKKQKAGPASRGTFLSSII